LINLTEIQDAEEGRLKEPPWCFTKTQFGPVEGHLALVEMLTALKREFVHDLEVSDEGGYWETRDLAELVRERALVQGAIDGLSEGLRRYGLSRVRRRKIRRSCYGTSSGLRSKSIGTCAGRQNIRQ
jgi:hypothetical protein